jgi:hypothetical protein
MEVAEAARQKLLLDKSRRALDLHQTAKATLFRYGARVRESQVAHPFRLR